MAQAALKTHYLHPKSVDTEDIALQATLTPMLVEATAPTDLMAQTPLPAPPPTQIQIAGAMVLTERMEVATQIVEAVTAAKHTANPPPTEAVKLPVVEADMQDKLGMLQGILRAGMEETRAIQADMVDTTVGKREREVTAVINTAAEVEVWGTVGLGMVALAIRGCGGA